MPQPVARVLVDEAPVGARAAGAARPRPSPARMRRAGRVAVAHAAGIGRSQAGQHAQQRGLAASRIRRRSPPPRPARSSSVHAVQRRRSRPKRRSQAARAGSRRASLIPPPPARAWRVAAVIGVGADEHPPARDRRSPPRRGSCRGCRTARRRAAARIGRKGWSSKSRLRTLGVGRHGVDPLLAPGAEQLQRRHAVHLRVVEGRDGRGRHQVAPVHHAPGSCS